MENKQEIETKVTCKNRLKLFFSKNIFILFIFLIIYLGLLLGAENIEMKFSFPGKDVKSDNLSTYFHDIENFEEVNIDDGFGNNINGLYIGTGTGKTIYFFHGNGGPLHYFYDDILYLNSMGYNIMAYDYPGYGKSTGLPYKNNTEKFSKVFYEYIKENKGLKESDLIIWGYSIGSGVGVDFASKNIFDKLVLISPLSSRYDYSKYAFGFPIQKLFFLKDSFINKEKVQNISNNTLILHGNKDKIIPFWHGENVFNNSVGNKYFIELDNFGHNGIISKYGEALKYVFLDFLEGNDLNIENNYLFLDDLRLEEIIEKNKKLEIEYKKIEFLNSIDLLSDNSIHKFVTSNISFNDKSYVPKNLVSISGKYVYDPRGGTQIVTIETRDALYKMAEAFYKDFNKSITIASAYRSYNYQKGIKDRGCPDNLCAKAGFSEHQSGLAVDFWEASSESSWKNNKTLTSYFNWLKENAHKYGFHNTYQRGLKIDGYDIEPWHWRYVGIELATYLKENNLTIAEFYKEQITK